MVEIAALGLKADSTGVVKATGDLDKLTEAAGRAEGAADKLAGGAGKASAAVKREGDAARQAANDNRTLGRETQAVEGSMHRMAEAAGAVAGKLLAMAGAALSIGAYIKVADAWSDMQSRIGAAVKDMEAAPALMGRMVDLANASYSPLSQTVEVYARNVGVLRDLGYTATQTADFTEALNHALVITATKGEQAASVQNALAKAMALGKLQADGLETVLASGGRVAEALAAELGTTTNGLRAMATAGQITSGVIAGAMLKSLEDLRREAGEMPATVADGITRIGTGIQYLIGAFDQTVQASGSLAGALVGIGDAVAGMARWVSENGSTIAFVFDSVVGTAIVGVTALVVKLGVAAASFGSMWVYTMVQSAVATGTLSGAMYGLAGAIASTGIGAIAVVAGVLVGQFLRLVQATGSFGDALSHMGNLGKAVALGLYDGFRGLMHGLAGVASFIQAAFVGAFVGIAKAWDGVANGIAKTWNALADSRLGSEIGLTTIELSDAAGSLQDASTSLYNTARGSFGKAGELLKSGSSRVADAWSAMSDTIAEAEDRVASIEAPTIAAANALEKTEKAAKGAGKAYKDLLAELNKELDARQAMIGLNDKEAARRRAMQQVYQKLGDEAKRYTRADIQGTAERIVAIEENERAWEKFKDRTEQFASDMVDSFLESSRSIMDAFKNLLRSLVKEALLTPVKVMVQPIVGAMQGAFGIGGMGAAGTAVQAAGAMPSSGILGSLAGGASAFGGGMMTGASAAFNGFLGGGFTGAMKAVQVNAAFASGTLGTLGTALGAVALPLAAVAAVFSFFGKKTKELDAGLRLTVDGMETLVEQFRKTETKKFWGLSKKTSTSYVAADRQTQDALSYTVGALQAGVLDAAAALGVGAGAFQKFSHVMQVSTKGMTDEEALKAVQEAVGGLGNSFAGLVPGLRRVTRQGEDAMAALTRISTALTVANEGLGTLGLSLFNVSVSGGNAASKFTDLFGGIDAFVQSADFYYQNFYSLSERYAGAQQRISDALDEFGVKKVPATEKAFRKLVERFDAAGRSKGVAALMQIAPAFIEMLEMGRELTGSGDAGAGVDDSALRERMGLQRQLLQLEGKTAQLRRLELKELDPTNREMQRRIWALQDEQAVAREAEGLQRRLLQVQGDTAALRRLDLAALDKSNRALQRQIWSAEKAAAVASEKEGLERRLLEVQGRVSAVRQLELAALDKSNRAIQRQIWAAERAAEVASERTDLDRRLLEAQGDTAALRKLELAALDPTNRALLRQIWAQENANEAAERAAQIADERHGLELRWLELQGDTLAVRGRELLETDEANQALLQRIWALEDERSALERVKAIQEERRSIEDRLLDLMGATAEIRRRESDALDPVNRALHQLVYNLTDAQAGADAAREAMRAAADAERARIGDLRSMMDGVRSSADQALAAVGVAGEAQRQAAERQIRTAIQTGRVWDEQLGGLAETVAALDTGNFASRQAYQLAAARAGSVLGALADAQGKAANTAESRLEAALEKYGLKDATVLSLANAMSGLDKALRQLSTVQSVSAAALGIKVPAFASGGVHTGGLRIVGERGPEIEATGPARIWSAGQAQEMLSGNGNAELLAEVRALRAEVKQLREEQRQLGHATADNTRKTVNRLDGMTRNGLAVGAPEWSV